jgi:hypothetical protein
MQVFIPIIVLLVTVLIARIVNERSYKLLPTEGKARLVDLFSRERIYGYLFLIVIIAVFFLVIYFV